MESQTHSDSVDYPQWLEPVVEEQGDQGSKSGQDIMTCLPPCLLLMMFSTENT